MKKHSLKVTTWNVNSIKSRLALILVYLWTSGTDLLFLQETRGQLEVREVYLLTLLGYQILNNPGVKGRAGTAILYRSTERFKVSHYVDVGYPGRCEFAAFGGVRNFIVVNVYVHQGSSYSYGRQSSRVNSRYFDHANFLAKLGFLRYLVVTVSRLQRSFKVPLILLGDLNVVLTKYDVWHGRELGTTVSFTPVERSLVQTLIYLTQDAFPGLKSTDRFTWYDYRQGGYPKGNGMRIDYVLYSKFKLVSYRHWTTFRKPGEVMNLRVSDHLPVMCEFVS